MRFHKVPHDGEPETQPAVQTRAGCVGLAKFIKDVGQEFGFDADARIGYPDFGIPSSLAQFDENMSAVRREFHGIGEQVP